MSDIHSCLLQLYQTAEGWSWHCVKKCNSPLIHMVSRCYIRLDTLDQVTSWRISLEQSCSWQNEKCFVHALLVVAEVNGCWRKRLCLPDTWCSIKDYRSPVFRFEKMVLYLHPVWGLENKYMTLSCIFDDFSHILSSIPSHTPTLDRMSANTFGFKVRFWYKSNVK